MDETPQPTAPGDYILSVVVVVVLVGNTPLIYSAMVGNDMAIEILIKSFRRLGLNVDHVNRNGLTALLIAAKHGFIESATILSLEGRACISFRDRDKGMNAEEWARSRGCSTPEVLPFSTNAALWNFKFSRHDVFAAGRAAQETCPPENEAAQRVGEETSDNKTPSSASSSSRRIDVDELSRRLAEIQNKQIEWGYLHPSLAQMGLVDRLRHKRCSLPAMKFFNYSRCEEDSGPAPRIGTVVGDPQQQQQQQTTLLSVGPAAAHAAGKRHSCYPDSAMAPSSKEGLSFPPVLDTGGGGGGGGASAMFLSVGQNAGNAAQLQTTVKLAQPNALQIPNGDRPSTSSLSCTSSSGSVAVATSVKVSVFADGGTGGESAMASASTIDFDLDSNGTGKSEIPINAKPSGSKK